MKISPEELTSLSELIHRQCGIVLDSTKGYLVESRLGPLLEEYSLPSYNALCFKASQSLDLVNYIVDIMTTNETSFFRDLKPFDLLQKKILPDWLASSGSKEKELKIWSSASSTGQEVYSTAIILMEFFGRNISSYKIKITGTDIADSVIAKARAANYSKLEVGRGLPPEFLDKYFDIDGHCWKVKDALRSFASFRKQNLLSPFNKLDKFNIIFCRNVAIYFSTKDRQALFSRMADQLVDDGILIIGSTESLFGICDKFERNEHNGSTYYTIKK